MGDKLVIVYWCVIDGWLLGYSLLIDVIDGWLLGYSLLMCNWWVITWL